MQILLINGSPHTNGATAKALDICEGELLKLGAACVRFNIGGMPRHACCGCGGCADGGSCVFGDLDELYRLISESQGIIIGTPTHFGVAPGTLLSVLSRLIISNKAAIDGKPIAAVAVGRRGALSEARSSVLGFFRFTNCPTVNAQYPAIGYFDSEQGEAYDGEGAQNMRRTARRLYILARALDIGNKAEFGNDPEEKIKTDVVSLAKRLTAQ